MDVRSSTLGDQLWASVSSTGLQTSLRCRQQFVNVKASHSSGGQLLLVESGQSFGSTVDHLPLAHTRHGQVPLTLVQVGSTALEKLAHGDQQTGPAQVVVGGGEGLSLEQPQEEQQQLA